MRMMIFSAVLFSFIAACNRQSTGDAFGFKPDPHAVYNVVKTKQSTEEWTYEGTPRQAVHYTETGFVLEPQQQQDSSTVVKITFDRFRIKELNVDTEKPSPTAQEVSDDPAKLWDYLLHLVTQRSLQVTIDNHGVVKNVQGIAALLDSVCKVSGNDKMIVRAYLRDVVSKEAIQDDLNEMFCFLPAREKEPGQSWVTDIVYSSKAPVKWSNVYILDSIKHNYAFMSVNATVSARDYMKGRINGRITAGYTDGMPYEMDLSEQTVTNTKYYDITSRTSIKVTTIKVK